MAECKADSIHDWTANVKLILSMIGGQNAQLIQSTTEGHKCKADSIYDWRTTM